MNNFLTLILTTSLYLCLDIQNSISVGYEDNFLRFSDLEMNSNLFENGTSNDYMGDSRFFDSSIISPSTQLTYHSKINDYKTKTIIRFKFNEYQSSNQKSYFNLNARYEIKLKSYNWIKFSYSLTPRYYLRTFIDRDLVPLVYYPCYFSNENFYLSYSHPIANFKKTWMDIKFNINNQFYNENFTEFDTRVYTFEGSIKSSFIKSYFLSMSYFLALAENISYGNQNQFYESTKIDRSYTKHGFKMHAKKTLKNSFINSLSLKLKYSIRDYDLDSWYYEYDNWKKYYETEFILELTKKLNKKTSIKISGKHFYRDVVSSQSKETLWIEDYKIYNRNELWFKFIYNFRYK